MIKTIVVDNDALIRDIVQKILEDNSQIELIHKAEDGFDALEYLEINKVDLVLLDIKHINSIYLSNHPNL